MFEAEVYNRTMDVQVRRLRLTNPQLIFAEQAQVQSLCSAEMPSGRRGTWLQRFGAFRHQPGGPCSSLRSAGVA
jgi:hypothetical protein